MFKKIYYAINTYKIYENANGRFVDEGYPLYVKFLADGNLPTLEIDSSVADILEIVDGIIQYKPDYEATLLLKAKNNAKNTLYNNRLIKDNGGFEFSGMIIATDINSQSILANAYIGAKNGLLESGTKWKTENGDIDLTKEQVIAIYEAVFNFIRTNFNTEITKRALIDACITIAEVEAIDLSI
jgi:hypothetical protein